MKNLTNMNKTELLAVCANYGMTTHVKVTNATLIHMITVRAHNEEVCRLEEIDAKQDAVESFTNVLSNIKSNKEMGDVNMTNNNNSVMVSVDDMVAQLKGIMNISSKAIVSRVNTHTTKVGTVILARLSAMDAKIDALATKPVYNVPAKNPTTTVKQYNKDAAQLAPIGQVLNAKTGTMVNYYGVCATCGTKVTSPNVVAYANLNNKGVCVCFSCQSKAKKASPKTASTEKKASYIKAPVIDANNGSITKACSYCAKKLVYANVDMMKVSVAKAQGLSLKPYCCSACAKKVLATQTSVPVVAPKEIVKEEQTSFVPFITGESAEIGNTENQGF